MPPFSWRLPSGALRLTLDREDPPYSLAQLLSVGARQNPKRPFVFVSHVLGKHLPARPSAMKQVQARLAGLLSAAPAVFIGMAETATGLAEGVYAAWREQTGADGVYLSTTRYQLDGHRCLDFTESHSHATDLRLYCPQEPLLAARAQQCERVVLIDDELSTGKTFASLATVMRGLMPKLRAIDVVAVTDFSGTQVQQRLNALPFIERVQVHALLSGEFSFEQAQPVAASAQPAQLAVGCRRARMSAATARLGYAAAPNSDPRHSEQCRTYAAGQPITLIATGECMYPAQALGEQLEADGADVQVQSTTRSPLQIYGPIGSSLQVTDPYGEGVPNFIYNRPDHSRRAIIIHETGDNPDIRRLVEELGAPALDPFHGLWLSPRGDRSVA